MDQSSGLGEKVGERLAELAAEAQLLQILRAVHYDLTLYKIENGKVVPVSAREHFTGVQS